MALLDRRYEAAPHPENLYDLADMLSRAGRREESAKAFGTFEKQALLQSAKWDNANRELIAYYCGAGAKPREALRVARMEIARRQDVHTRDAYAWALFANGKTGEARREIARALAVGTRDETIARHARAIAGSATGRKGGRAS